MNCLTEEDAIVVEDAGFNPRIIKLAQEKQCDLCDSHLVS